MDAFKKLLEKFPQPRRDKGMTKDEFQALAPIDSKTYPYHYIGPTVDGKKTEFRVVVSARKRKTNSVSWKCSGKSMIWKSPSFGHKRPSNQPTPFIGWRSCPQG